MSMYYSHLLVPPDPNFVFDRASMTAFLEAVAKAGFVGKDAERFVVFPPDQLFEDHLSAESGLAFAVPELLALAEELLGSRFRQTCAWG
jgi:hypothetical protein